MAKAKPIDQTTFAGRIAAEIRRRRVKLGFSVEDAAAAAEVPAPTWYRWEQGRGLPLDALPGIAATLKCNVRQIVPAK